jgi:hypothetical protein
MITGKASLTEVRIDQSSHASSADQFRDIAGYFGKAEGPFAGCLLVESAC